MKKIGLLGIILPLIATTAQADDKLALTQAYHAVIEDYVAPASVEDLAIPALQALNKMDNRIRIANDGEKISLYGNARLLKTLRKPTNPNDVIAWLNITDTLVNTAKKASKTLEVKDFEIVDTILMYGIKNFDADSSYYPDLELSTQPKTEFKPQRAYYDRLLEDDVLYIRLGAINQYTAQNVEESLKKYSQAKGLIIDVRGNPGGVLEEAVKVAGLFLDGGIVASAQGKEGSAVEYYNAPSGDIWQDKPIVVLIDGQTASSAEVLAVALQEQSRGTVIGTNSFGKGTIQKLITLDNNSRLALTNGFIYTPSGNKLAGRGVMPDICTSGELESRNPENILAKNKNMTFCPKEDRETKSQDINVAKAYLQKHTKKGLN